MEGIPCDVSPRGRQRNLTSEVPLTTEVDVPDALTCPDSIALVPDRERGHRA